MRVFERLRALRAFEKRSLPFVKSLEDFDLVIEIGYHQEQRKALTLKQVYLLGIGSIATVQRRLSVLKKMGVVLLKRSKEDARTVELTLSPKVCKTLPTVQGSARPNPRSRLALTAQQGF